MRGVLPPSCCNHGNIPEYCHIMEIKLIASQSELVKIRFQCVSRIVDLRHIEIINWISKLNKLRINFVTIIDLESGWGNHIYNKKLILVTFSKYPK